MLFNVILFYSLSSLSVVLAVPSRLGTHVARRGTHSSPNNLHEVPGIHNTLYSNNWAGAGWNEDSNTFTSVTGTFTTPTPTGSTGASAAAWVGIDGNSCRSVILQTGVTFTVEAGRPTYAAWYEWYPDPPYYFTNIDISAGDDIKLTVTAYTPTSGTVVIDNLSNGQTVSQNATSSNALCGQDAEWIVEDYMEGNSLVLFADFGTVTFTDNVASGAQVYTQTGATTYDIRQNNQTLTYTSISGSSIVVEYV